MLAIAAEADLRSAAGFRQANAGNVGIEFAGLSIDDVRSWPTNKKPTTNPATSTKTRPVIAR